jgi:glycerophosphoryl diester phosphodiesterase
VTLDSVLRLDTKKVMLVEIKTSNPDYSKLSKILNSYPNKNIYVMSFHNHVIKNLKKYQKNYKLGILNYIINSEEKYEYDFICLLNDLVDNKIINYYLNHKIEVFMYGVINEKNNLYYDNTYYILDHEPVKK